MKDYNKAVVQLRTVAKWTGSLLLSFLDSGLLELALLRKSVFITSGHNSCLPHELTWKTGGFEDKKIKNSCNTKQEKGVMQVMDFLCFFMVSGF